jgi:hypothetical protein
MLLQFNCRLIAKIIDTFNLVPVNNLVNIQWLFSLKNSIKLHSTVTYHCFALYFFCNVAFAIVHKTLTIWTGIDKGFVILQLICN